jgi:hypothetical protein
LQETGFLTLVQDVSWETEADRQKALDEIVSNPALKINFLHSILPTLQTPVSFCGARSDRSLSGKRVAQYLAYVLALNNSTV